VFQDRFAVPSKWFHSADFSPVFGTVSVMERTYPVAPGGAKRQKYQ
jgi:hypothetical protein